jgi:alanyl-tRNA synthetase
VTERLYYHDSYLWTFRARVVEASADRRCVYLDRTAFYPTSGGQPFDTGELGGAGVVDVVDEGERIAHLLSDPIPFPAEVEGRIDADRRFDHMQQHTGQHLLSAVLIELFDAPTVGFHLGAEASTIDIGRVLESNDLREAERRANQIVFENRPVTVQFRDSSEDLGLRKATERVGEVRIVSIEGVDQSACGGTHVRRTGEIGPILLRKTDRVRGNMRLEFLCGRRAVTRARADFDALSAIARSFSAPLDDAPGLVDAQREKLADADKERKRLVAELAQARGRSLHSDAAPGTDGIRRILRRTETLTDEWRVEGQSFVSSGRGIYLAVAQAPPAVLLVASEDSGVDAGQLLKGTLSEAGGRGGGNRQVAQGSLGSKEALDGVVSQLGAKLGFPSDAPGGRRLFCLDG